MKALVLGSGGLRGAYDAGVAATLCRELGHDYFDAIYMSSVGVLNGAFFIANEPATLEHAWRRFVSGNQLVNYLNPLKGRNILDTEYLVEIFKDGRSYLSLNSLFAANVKMVYALENLKTARVEYIEPNKDNIFELMRAATAVPLVHKPVAVNGGIYLDGGLTDPLPVRKAIEDGFTDITVIYNKPEHFYVGTGYKIGLPFITRLVQPKLRKHLKKLEDNYKEIEKYIESRENVRVIRPTEQITSSLLNTQKKTIDHLIDLGIEDTKRYIKALV